MRHVFKVDTLVMYDGKLPAIILKQLEYDPELDSSPVYQVKLVRSGMPIIVRQRELERPSDNLLSNLDFVNMVCDCGQKHTKDWNIHSSWCTLVRR